MFTKELATKHGKFQCDKENNRQNIKSEIKNQSGREKAEKKERALCKIHCAAVRETENFTFTRISKNNEG